MRLLVAKPTAPGTSTDTGRVPAAWGGTEHTRAVGVERAGSRGHTEAPMYTVEAVVRPVPVTVKTTPLADVEGVTEVTDGVMAGLKVAAQAAAELHPATTPFTVTTSVTETGLSDPSNRAWCSLESGDSGARRRASTSATPSPDVSSAAASPVLEAPRWLNHCCTRARRAWGIGPAKAAEPSRRAAIGAPERDAHATE